MTETTVKETAVWETRLDEIMPGLASTCAQFVDLLRSLEPDAGDVPVPGLTWTVGDTAAHMYTIVRRGTGDFRRASSLPGLAALNDETIAEVETRSPAELADLLETEMATLLGLLGGWEQERATEVIVDLHAGVKADLPSALSYILFDLIAHGQDIAGATGRDWLVDAGHAALVMHAGMPLVAPWLTETVRTGPAQRMALSFPGDDVALVFAVGAGGYRAENVHRSEAGHVDEVDPVEAFLAMCRRAPAVDPVVARFAAWFDPI